jgi:hypothetical protein
MKLIIGSHKIMQITEKAAYISNKFIMDIHNSTDNAYVKNYLYLFKHLQKVT